MCIVVTADPYLWKPKVEQLGKKTLRGVKGVSMETQMQGLKAFEGIRHFSSSVIIINQESPSSQPPRSLLLAPGVFKLSCSAPFTPLLRLVSVYRPFHLYFIPKTLFTIPVFSSLLAADLPDITTLVDWA